MSALLEAWQKTVRRGGTERAIVEAGTGAAGTFAELEARARAWRAEHSGGRDGLRREVVVFALPNGMRWFEVFIGLVQAGAVAVPLDGAEPREAQHGIARAIRARFWWDGTRLVDLGSGSRRFRDPETCLVKLTSGSTGAPRSLVFTGEQMLADARQVTRTMGITRRDVNYALIPFGHSYGLGNLTVPLMAQGVRLICGTLPLPHAIATEVNAWRPTVFPTVPAVVRALAEADLSSKSLAPLRTVISAGAPLAAETARAFAARFGRRVHNFYGSSETGGIAYDRTGRATLTGSVGRAMSGVSIQPRRGNRIQVASAAVFTHGNRRRHGKLGAWVPADRATIDARGAITLLGRRGHTVKVGGRRVNLAEVLARVRRIAGVRDAWVGVNGAADVVMGAAVVATCTAADLRAEMLADTASWKVPKRWAVLTEFPLTQRGKVDTRALHAAVFG